MRFGVNEDIVELDPKSGVSPTLNFDTFGYSIRTNLIFFLNEDSNTLIVNII